MRLKRLGAGSGRVRDPSWPTVWSGEVPGGEGYTWENVDAWLRRRGTSLSQLTLELGRVDRDYRSFEEARGYARSLCLPDNVSWYSFAREGKLPRDIPAKVDRAYRGKGWVSWGDWLGTGRVAPVRRVFRPFAQAQSFVSGLGLRTRKDWLLYVRSGLKPEDIPASAERVYRTEWKGFYHWIGYDHRAA